MIQNMPPNGLSPKELEEMGHLKYGTDGEKTHKLVPVTRPVVGWWTMGIIFGGIIVLVGIAIISVTNTRP